MVHSPPTNLFLLTVPYTYLLVACPLQCLLAFFFFFYFEEHGIHVRYYASESRFMKIKIKLSINTTILRFLSDIPHYQFSFSLGAFSSFNSLHPCISIIGCITQSALLQSLALCCFSFLHDITSFTL